MKKKKKNKLVFYIAIPLSLLILLFVFTTIFEYTALAEIRESFSTVNKDERLAYGNVLFETRGCSGCHAIEPNLRSFAPNLFGLSERMPEAYIRESIVTPEAVIVDGYSDLKMPNFGEILDSRQVDALVVYIKEMK